MFPRNKRIGKTLFPNVFRQGRIFSSPTFSLRVRKNENKNTFAVVVPESVSPLATRRNVLKRRGYVVLRKIDKKITPPVSVILLFKKGSEKMTFSKLESEIKDLCKKSGILS